MGDSPLSCNCIKYTLYCSSSFQGSLDGILAKIRSLTGMETLLLCLVLLEDSGKTCVIRMAYFLTDLFPEISIRLSVSILRNYT